MRLKIVFVLTLPFIVAAGCRSRSLPEMIAAARTADSYSDSDTLILPGLKADRRTRKVTLRAESTGLRENDIIEFYLVGPGSSHGYEAYAVSSAKPGDFQKALEFTGMNPGKPFDPETTRLWPKGERVILKFSCEQPGNRFDSVPSEEIFSNTVSDGSIPAGHVFSGSLRIPDPESPVGYVYACDVRDPFSLASNYNEPESVLDVPMQAPQKGVYGNYKINKKYVLPQGTPLIVTAEPEYKTGKKRVVDLFLNVGPGKQADAAAGPDDLFYDLKRANGGPGEPVSTLNGMLQELVSLVENGHDPFVTVSFDGALPIGSIRDVCGLLSSIENEKGIRIDPPPAGQLYCRAFVPDEQYRARDRRIMQPLELHLKPDNGKMSARLTEIHQEWRKDKIKPDLKITEHDIAGPSSLKETVDGLTDYKMAVLLVFADPALTYARLMEYIDPVMERLPLVHVFLDPKP